MARRLALALLLCLTLSTACRQILGLKQAHQEPDAGGAAGSTRTFHTMNGVAAPGVSCETAPGPSCLECRDKNCNGAETQCLADHKCRIYLGDYAICLGRGCDGDFESCSSEHFGQGALTSCINTCSQECGQTPLVSPCELYCACMTECPAEDQRVLGDCMATCESAPMVSDPRVKSCRRAHCEMAQDQAQLQAQAKTPDKVNYYMSKYVEHCTHASGRVDICASMLASIDRKVCLDANESTWPCNYNSDCCSGKCISGACL